MTLEHQEIPKSVAREKFHRLERLRFGFEASVLNLNFADLQSKRSVLQSLSRVERYIRGDAMHDGDGLLLADKYRPVHYSLALENIESFKPIIVGSVVTIHELKDDERTGKRTLYEIADIFQDDETNHIVLSGTYLESKDPDEVSLAGLDKDFELEFAYEASSVNRSDPSAIK